MNSSYTLEAKQIPPGRLLVNHFYIGIAITLFYILLAPKVIYQGFPGFSILLIAEILILAPLGLIHLWFSSNGDSFTSRFKDVILLRERLSIKLFLVWTGIGILSVLLVYVPHYPLGLALRENYFAWLPEWYFNPTFGTDNLQLVARLFLIGILVDGLIGPVVEELFFRGYLLPRMAYFKNWAPIINGSLFGLYHFWQPHNMIASIAIGIILSYIVWKKRNVYLGIAIHCTLNILGSLSGYLASIEGIFVGR